MDSILLAWGGLALVPFLFSFIYLIFSVFEYSEITQDKDDIIEGLVLVTASLLWPVTLACLLAVFLYRLVMILIGRK